MRHSILLGFCLSLALSSGCAHVFSDLTARTPSRGEQPAPTDAALFTVFRGARGSNPVVLFAEDGTPVCQLPSRTHCAVQVSPGHHRFYVYWSSEFVDVIDADVVAGQRYFATIAAGYFRPIDEKLNPQTENWVHLAEYYQTDETHLAPEGLETIRAAIPDFAAVRAAGDHTFEGYDENHRLAHTVSTEDGI